MEYWSYNLLTGYSVHYWFSPVKICDGKYGDKKTTSSVMYRKHNLLCLKAFFLVCSWYVPPVFSSVHTSPWVCVCPPCPTVFLRSPAKSPPVLACCCRLMTACCIHSWFFSVGYWNLYCFHMQYGYFADIAKTFLEIQFKFQNLQFNATKGAETILPAFWKIALCVVTCCCFSLCCIQFLGRSCDQSAV